MIMLTYILTYKGNFYHKNKIILYPFITNIFFYLKRCQAQPSGMKNHSLFVQMNTKNLLQIIWPFPHDEKDGIMLP